MSEKEKLKHKEEGVIVEMHADLFVVAFMQYSASRNSLSTCL
jgi:hypothetical protein